MEPLNYCRQAIQVLGPNAERHPDRDVRLSCSMAVSTIASAAKFMLPEGGRILPDKFLRGLDGIELLSLPFQTIALEFRDSGGRKHITVATQRDDDIAMQHIFSSRDGFGWSPTSLILMSRSQWITRVGDESIPNVTPVDPAVPTELALEPAVEVLMFLNALACSNVSIERREPRKAAKKAKRALPFDAYHVLVVDVPGVAAAPNSGAEREHRSPREHLRRGHIRRLQDGRRIWVNATVVAAGRQAGVITKDYALVNRPIAVH
jgi:hypothetical protein